ncbi:MAG: hypothetical protein DI603_14100 [Roseateles depolymerans]|uniref:Uncharacterized protein n=1 Tax=Roseateles depolymerans TaxID=76731 RepID=A0A2W5FD57_9BURK|nr:MAG: hypothetical protein DI603_14100 [Roseateles depolymerans]
MSNFSAQASFDFASLRRATITAPKDQRQPTLQARPAGALASARAAIDPVRTSAALGAESQGLTPASLR